MGSAEPSKASINDDGGGASTSGSVKKFPLAAQPEIMRAAEKDDQYASFVYEACRDAFRHLFGTRVAVAYQNEAKLLGQMLYYMLTTGAGKQTLGEEYCDITQAIPKRSVGTSRRYPWTLEADLELQNSHQDIYLQIFPPSRKGRDK